MSNRSEFNAEKYLLTNICWSTKYDDLKYLQSNHQTTKVVSIPCLSDSFYKHLTFHVMSNIVILNFFHLKVAVVWFVNRTYFLRWMYLLFIRDISRPELFLTHRFAFKWNIHCYKPIIQGITFHFQWGRPTDLSPYFFRSSKRPLTILSTSKEQYNKSCGWTNLKRKSVDYFSVIAQHFRVLSSHISTSRSKWMSKHNEV